MFHADLGFGAGAKDVLNAIGKSLAIIEFTPSGTVIDANENFCKVLGYERSEIKGKHHSLFVAPDYVKSQDYADFWKKLAAGSFEAREYMRIGKGGREVWIQASYNPVMDGKTVVKVVKIATDITQAKMKSVEDAGKLEAISRAQAVIEFSVDGRVLTANDNFLKALGYSLNEVQGQHHKMFVDPAYAQTPEYAEFWTRLGRGEYIAEDFRRIRKDGREVWIQASYNPIFDTQHRIIKVVKIATDLTDRMLALKSIGDGLSKLAKGDLTQRLEVPFIPSLESLRRDFNASIGTLHDTLSRVGLGAQAIESGVGEITQASDELSKRTEQQAANLEQTAAALEEITTAVRNTAAGTQTARNSVAAVRQDAERSGKVVADAVTAMGQIEKSSSQITQIISVIDEIAFQTNLLALNAGVEAARAGEAGRGFAVVAQEVRALAQRSAEAAKEIKGLISTSTAQVASGVTLVGETGRALTRIVQQVAEIATVVSEIATSAQEQASGLQEVNTAITQMDQLTQQNAAMVEESTAASHSVNREVLDLSGLISHFRCDRHATEAARVVGRNAQSASRGKSTPQPTRTMMKTVSQGSPGAARKPVSSQDTWEDF